MRIGINCGHTVSGTVGCGAVGYIDESNEVRKVGNVLCDMLKNAGHTVINCTNDYAPSVSSNLKQIVDMANAHPLDLFVSIHFNSGGGRGTEVWTNGGTAFGEATATCEKLSGLGFKNRGIKDGKGLYVIKHTTAKAMLIEVCFVDTDDYVTYNKVGYKAVAKAICEGITGEKSANKEDLTMTQYEELKKEIEKLKAENTKLKNVVESTTVYNYMDNNMPEWAKESVQAAMDCGALQGDDEGKLGLSYKDLRTICREYRCGVFDK